MKTFKFIVFALAVVVCFEVRANPVVWSTLGLYADTLGTSGDVFDTGPGLLDIHVVATINAPPEVSGIDFFAPPLPCFDAVHVKDTSKYTVIGNSQGYAMVSFDGCLSGTILIMTITFSVQGTTPDCCWYYVHSSSGFTRCPSGSGEVNTYSGVWINPNAEHNCVAPIEETTWGGIKAMYE